MPKYLEYPRPRVQFSPIWTSQLVNNLYLFFYLSRLENVVRVIKGKIIYKITRREMKINCFTVACLVAWPLNESEAGVDLALIETSQLFLC